jgi:dCTP deaminase
MNDLVEAAPHSTPTARSEGGALLVDREIERLIGSAVRPVEGAGAIARVQLQASSLDLRLGPVAYRIRAGFLPGRTSIAERLAELETSRLSLEHGGAVLEKGLVYLVPLEEELALPADVAAAFNPRSSTGRCDLFTRVLVEDHPRFHSAPAGYRGKLWLEIAPLSFPVRLVRGDRLAQARFFRGDPALGPDELREVYARTPLCWVGDRPVPIDRVRFDGEGGLELHLGLCGRDPSGWRAQTHTGVLDFGREGAHAIEDYWEAVHSPAGHAILAPSSFYLFASRERVVVPPEYAAEMLPVDVDLGELRNNYAGFFDNGFGWSDEPAKRGTAAVLEVRAHDVPFLVEDGQVFFRLRYFRTSGAPEHLYGAGRSGASYRGQDLTPARCFRSPDAKGARA